MKVQTFGRRGGDLSFALLFLQQEQPATGSAIKLSSVGAQTAFALVFSVYRARLSCGFHMNALAECPYCPLLSLSPSRSPTYGQHVERTDKQTKHSGFRRCSRDVHMSWMTFLSSLHFSLQLFSVFVRHRCCPVCRRRTHHLSMFIYYFFLKWCVCVTVYVVHLTLTGCHGASDTLNIYTSFLGPKS